MLQPKTVVNYCNKLNLEKKYLPYTPEEASMVAMWRAVIWQALYDLEKGESKNIRYQASAWLSSGHEDFESVCALAFIDADLVRDLSRKIIKGLNNSQITKPSVKSRKNR